MKVLRSKQLWQWVAIVAIIIASIILLFMPDTIEHKYPYSYPRIQVEKQNVESLNSTLSSNESSIQSSISNVESLEIQKQQIAQEEFKLREGIVEEDFELHIPSILISLEQEAIKNEVELLIGYNSMTTTYGGGSSQGYEDFMGDPGMPSMPEDPSSPGNPERPERPEQPGRPERPGSEMDEFYEEEEMGGNVYASSVEDPEYDDEEVDANITVTEVQEPSAPEQHENTEGNEDPQANEESGIDGTTTQRADIPSIEGIDVTTIPLNISGNYHNVRNYIRYLDEIGMIEPSSVIIKSEGRTVTASIIIKIFHGEVN